MADDHAFNAGPVLGHVTTFLSVVMLSHHTLFHCDAWLAILLARDGSVSAFYSCVPPHSTTVKPLRIGVEANSCGVTASSACAARIVMNTRMKVSGATWLPGLVRERIGHLLRVGGGVEGDERVLVRADLRCPERDEVGCLLDR